MSRKSTVKAPFQVLNPQTGRPMFEVAADESGEPSLYLFSAAGNPVCVLGSAAEGGWFTLFNAQGKQVVSIQARESNGAGMVVLRAADEGLRVLLCANDEGATVEAHGPDSSSLVKLETVPETARVAVTHYPGTGALLAATPKSSSLVVGTPSGAPGATFAAVEDGGAVVFYGPDDSVVAVYPPVAESEGAGHEN